MNCNTCDYSSDPKKDSGWIPLDRKFEKYSGLFFIVYCCPYCGNLKADIKHIKDNRKG